MRNTILLISLFIINLLYCQNVPRFDQYPSKVEKVNKAKLILSSHPLGRQMKTRITEGYKEGKIDFGGHFVTVYWGAGTGLSLGAMVDAKTGKIYELPLNEDNAAISCGGWYDFVSNAVDSNLYITYSTSYYFEQNKCKRQVFYYLWDGKKFNLLKKITSWVKS